MKVVNSSSFLVLIIIMWCCYFWKPSEQKNDRDCIRWCGNISIPYPFGIGPPNCYYNSSFAVICKSSQIPILSDLNLEMVEAANIQNYGRYHYGEVTVKIPGVTACEGTQKHWSSPSLLEYPFEYTQNIFVSVGCDGYALFYDENGDIGGGCSSVCDESYNTIRECYGSNNCCQVDLDVTKSYSISVSSIKNGNCRTAFFISRDYFGILPSISGFAAPVLLTFSINSNYHKIALIFNIFYLLPAVISLILACCCVGLCWCRKTRKKRKEIRLKKKYFKGRLQEQRFNQGEAQKTKLFTEKELKKATENFNENRLIGKGGQGTVYKGMLSNGELVAVKKSHSLTETHWREFINEVIILSHINHRNVVKLLGCCLETKNAILVYEFIPNGTLSELIHSPNEELQLSSDIRVRITSEVAGAIAYLHSSCSTPIFHRDIKSNNILLDHKYKAKVCDFGISRSTSMDQTHLTTLVRGTFGYFDPEYFRSNQYSEKSDVYSFGVVLVEILTGKKPISVSSEYATSLVEQFMSSRNESGIYELLDPMILGSNVVFEDIMEVVSLAKRCLNLQGTGRPTMMQVAMELARLNKKFSAN